MRIEGDGSWQRTVIYDEDKTISYDCLEVFISKDGYTVYIDGNKPEKGIDTLIITGVYTIVGRGRFDNTKVFINQEALRGVQEISLVIASGYHTELNIDAILMPNMVEYVDAISTPNSELDGELYGPREVSEKVD